MADVHPTAMVDQRAVLAPGAIVGPGCVIEGAVRIGEGTRLMHHVSMKGPLTIGRNNLFHPGACIGYAPQDRGFDPDADGAGVTIGDGNTFHEGVTIHRATRDRPTAVGDANGLMPHSHIAHDAQLGSGCTLGSGSLLGGHVEIADGALLDGHASVHQFCRVGRLTHFHANTGATQDVPPFCTVCEFRRIGAVYRTGLQRAGHGQHVGRLEEAFDLLYRRRHTLSRAVEYIERRLGDDPLCMEFAAFIRASKRGITPAATGANEPV